MTVNVNKRRQLDIGLSANVNKLRQRDLGLTGHVTKRRQMTMIRQSKKTRTTKGLDLTLNANKEDKGPRFEDQCN